MKIPYTLHHCHERESATALLVAGTRSQELFDLIACLGLETFPTVFATADGFLIKLPRALETPMAGVVRLRKLADHLYLPVDAALVPPLLEDEARGLVRERGLVFLPGTRVLEFAFDRPLELGDLLQMPRPQVSPWDALPEPPALADELVEITSTVPRPDVNIILEQGRDEIGSESSRPGGNSGLGSKIAGGAIYAAGKSLAWLGTKLGLGGVAGAGANLLQRAFEAVPSLTERLMGQQEAALRNLLKDFRDGNTDKALRRALPLNASESKPLGAAGNASLPSHNLFYSLRNLLAGRQAAGGMWFTSDNLFYLLQAEYRKQAEAAARRGDYRRAAFIYAKLLNDMGAAAHILSQGGLHRDAAHIYEEVLRNARAAANEWQAAGEIDKAVEIYVRLGDDLAAADILYKVGEAERALVHFRNAAQKLASQKKYAEAGDLMLKRAQRPDLALTLFQEGWQTRPHAAALPCGLALAKHYAQEPDAPRFLQLLDDAQICLAPWSDDALVGFLNQMARLSNCAGLASVTDKAQDRCLLAVAEKMRQSSSSSATARAASQFFPADTPWPAPVARDAQYAFGLGRKPRFQGTGPYRLGRLGNSTVRAVCLMPLSGDLFLGFENGEIIHHRLSTGAARTLTKQAQPIAGLLADAQENNLVALAGSSDDKTHLLFFPRSLHFSFQSLMQVRTQGPALLCAGVDNQASPFMGVWAADRCQLYRTDNPSWSQSLPLSPSDNPVTGIVGSLPSAPEKPWCLLFFQDKAIYWVDGRVILTVGAPFRPENPPRNTLYQAPLQGWLVDQNTLAAQWVTKDAELYTLRLTLNPRGVHCSQPIRLRTGKPVYGIQGCIDHRLVSAAPMPIWDRVEAAWFSQNHLSNPVAAFPLGNSEALIVEADGTLVRIPSR